MNNRIRDLIERGYTLVTASSRQAHSLKSAYATHMIRAGNTVWRTPEILHWNIWMHRNLDEHQAQNHASPVLLNSSQSRLIWQSIIQSSTFTESILQIDAIVDTAMQAHETCLTCNIDIFDPDIFLNGDARAFRSWEHSYRTQLNQNNWIDELSLPDYLLASDFALAGTGVVLYGFDELTPQQQIFLDHLKAKGSEMVVYQVEGRNESATYHGYGDTQEEILASARWVKQILGNNAGASIGIVVPDLDHRREEISAAFDDVLHPGWVLEDPGSVQKLYAIAPGKPLSTYPVIHAAMEILCLGQSRHSIKRLEYLLRSSFIRGATGEADKRALLYVALRESGEPAWHLQTLLEFIERHQQYLTVPSQFVAMLYDLTAFLERLPKKQSPRQWCETFTAWLKLFGWPGERTLNSSEFQTVEEWREALLELAGLGAISKEWTSREALDALKKVLGTWGFQPETAEAPVQISGLPGVAGMGFDYLRITGMHDLTWPGPAIANPFIPLALQRDAGVPSCTAERTMQRCIRETTALIQSCRHIVFSYANMEEDREYRPSPLLKKYLRQGPEDFVQEQVDLKRLIFQARDLESFVDETAPAFSTQDTPRGGSTILADQSACPFRAFARHRLNASGLHETDIGLDPATRGSLVHAAMQGVWKRIESSENLKQITSNKLDSLIQAMVSGVIREQAGHQPETFTSEFRRLEGRRLVSLIRQWMDIEKTRPAFSIKGLEKRYETSFHGLNLRMRIDRIDELPDGSLLLMDYKTGEVNTRNWQGERPEEPQLPLYALTLAGEVNAVVFAGMKKGKLGFTGFSAEPDLIEGIVPISEISEFDSWEELFQDWERVLGKLAEEYLHGHAGVTPRDSKACVYCDLHSLCRIHERQVGHADMAGDESGWEE